MNRLTFSDLEKQLSFKAIQIKRAVIEVNKLRAEYKTIKLKMRTIQ